MAAMKIITFFESFLLETGFLYQENALYGSIFVSMEGMKGIITFFCTTNKVVVWQFKISL